MCKPEVLEAYYGTDVIKLNEDLIVPVNKGSSVLYSYVTSPNIRHLTLLDENCEKISQMFKKKKKEKQEENKQTGMFRFKRDSVSPPSRNIQK